MIAQVLLAAMSRGFWDWIVTILRENSVPLLLGLLQTFVIAFVSTAMGCLIGLGAGIIQTQPIPRSGIRKGLLLAVRGILAAYVEVFRGTPMMVQAAFLYYGLALLLDVQLPLLFAAFLIVSINTGAYLTETVRGGILCVDPGQLEAARAMGMRHGQMMRSIVLPQALRKILPQIGNNLIINIKDTCVLSIIGVMEFFYAIRGVAGKTYAFFPVYTLAMVFYFLLTFVCSRVLRRLERRLAGPEHYELVLNDALVAGEGMVHFHSPSPEEQNRDYQEWKREEEWHG